MAYLNQLIQVFRIITISIIVLSGCLRPKPYANHAPLNKYSLLYEVDSSGIYRAKSELFFKDSLFFMLKLWISPSNYYFLEGKYERCGKAIFFNLNDCSDSLLVTLYKKLGSKESVVNVNIEMEDRSLGYVQKKFGDDTLMMGALHYRFNDKAWLKCERNNGPFFLPYSEIDSVVQLRYRYWVGRPNIEVTQREFYSRVYTIAELYNKELVIKWKDYQYSCIDTLKFVGVLSEDEKELEMYFENSKMFSGKYLGYSW